MGAGERSLAHEVTVHDPVSHCVLQWLEPWVGSPKPLATVTCMPRTIQFTDQNVWRDGIVASRQEVRSRFSNSTSAPLGHREIEGLDAVGTRITTERLDASGAVVGEVGTELWYAPELDEVLVEQFTSASPNGQGLPSFALTQIQRVEPKPTLFYPPPGYKIESSYPYTR
jgi:hypothetical protein